MGIRYWKNGCCATAVRWRPFVRDQASGTARLNDRCGRLRGRRRRPSADASSAIAGRSTNAGCRAGTSTKWEVQPDDEVLQFQVPAQRRKPADLARHDQRLDLSLQAIASLSLLALGTTLAHRARSRPRRSCPRSISPRAARWCGERSSSPAATASPRRHGRIAFRVGCGPGTRARRDCSTCGSR